MDPKYAVIEFFIDHSDGVYTLEEIQQYLRNKGIKVNKLTLENIIDSLFLDDVIERARVITQKKLYRLNLNNSLVQYVIANKKEVKNHVEGN